MEHWTTGEIVLAAITVAFVIAYLGVIFWLNRKTNQIQKKRKEMHKAWPEIFKEEDGYATIEAAEKI